MLGKIENVAYVPDIKRISDFKKAYLILQSVFETQIRNQTLKLVCKTQTDWQTGTMTPLFPGTGIIQVFGNFELQGESLIKFANAISSATSWMLCESSSPGAAQLRLEWDQLYTPLMPVANQN